MEALSDLKTFTKILTEKGYNGYFHTQGAYAGKLKDSIGDYLESCQKGTDSLPKHNLLLTGYLKWSGEDKARVECNMWVKYVNGKFFLDSMVIAKKDQFEKVLKQSKLTGISVMTVPKAMDAIALVDNEIKQKAEQTSRRFKL
ncbi:TPA: hypothetical protein L3261_002774 [Elizabethkingia anophelis]|nr:hypothetical protein [Elizabethkingia anophelis]HBN6707288.1 hypothetical protein [Elizabethkingia anophelis]HBN6711322.1 hypothetical protein [Elizabethkingia anophelis]HBN6714108.1 hypothetical protein [Elizabethkingia anophelis]HBN6719646.1 hypothetical protein [Elizabethkingia anophelis]